MIPFNTVMRVARPTDDLKAIAQMYLDGLGFEVLGQFENHEGFDGIIIGHKQHACHLEFTHHQDVLVGKAPSQEHLLVFYLADFGLWQSACHQMEAAGFQSVAPYNPYWATAGKTYEDLDGYRIVLQNGAWKV